MCLFLQVTKCTRKGASCPYLFLIVDDPITYLKGGLLIFSIMSKWYQPVFDPTLRHKKNKIWNVESESILCLEGISTHLYVLLDISRWDQVDVCSHCSPRYLDGIKLLQRGGGGRVGRGCWGRGQLLVIIKYSRIRYRTELRCVWQILRRRTSSRFSKRLRKSMRAKLQPSIFTVSAHLQKKTLVNITFYMCIKSFQVSDSESSESELEDVI